MFFPCINSDISHPCNVANVCVYFPTHFTMKFGISCSCHDKSQSAVTKQKHQFAIY